MIKKICFSLSVLSLATSIATAVYLICCKKKTESKADLKGNNKVK